MGWLIDVQGARLAEEDVKAAHVSVVNATLGTTGWDVLDPLSSPEALIVWCAVSVSTMTGKDLDESLLFIQSLPMQTVIGYYHAEPVPAEPPAVVERVAPWPDGVEERPGQLLTNDQRRQFVEASLRAAQG